MSYKRSHDSFVKPSPGLYCMLAGFSLYPLFLLSFKILILSNYALKKFFLFFFKDDKELHHK